MSVPAEYTKLCIETVLRSRHPEVEECSCLPNGFVLYTPANQPTIKVIGLDETILLQIGDQYMNVRYAVDGDKAYYSMGNWAKEEGGLPRP